jgi:glutamyl-tRNA reductase
MAKYKIGQSKDSNSLIVIGANHRSSTMILRDQLHIQNPDLPIFYKRLKDIGVDQTIIFSTSNSTEFILVSNQKSANGLSKEVIKLLAAYTKESRNEIKNQTYCLKDQEAIRHIFAVASALDSLIIGDSKAVDLLKLAHQIARDNGMAGDYLNNLINHATETATRILRETEIGLRPISIPAAAVQVARDLHGDLAHSSCLLIGAGEMGELLASSMKSAGVSKIIVSHPSLARAEIVSQNLNCHVSKFENLTQLLTQSDVIITSMNSRQFILDSNLLRTATKIRKRKPIFIIDIGVPGDIDKTVELPEDIFLYTLDDLEIVTKEGRSSRFKETEIAWDIIDEEINKLSDYHSAETIKLTNEEDTIEAIRRSTLIEANGDAEKATRLLIDRMKEMPKQKNRS